MKSAVHFIAAFVAWPVLLFAAVLSSSAQTLPVTLQLTSPVEFQVFQRANRSDGIVRIAGTLVRAGESPVALEARLSGGDAANGWRTLSVDAPQSAGFDAKLVVPAGGWYRLEVRARVGRSVLAQATVGHVGIGDIFVIAGQSNAANHGEERQKTQSHLVAALQNGNWQLANDPQPGASGDGGSFIPSFGEAMAERFRVPIGIISTAVGATSVREWLPRGGTFPNPPTLTGNVTQTATGERESNGRLFDNLIARMKAAGPDGIRAVLWHQGESDANQRDANRTLPGDLYQKYLEQVIRASHEELGRKIPWFVAQASYHTPDDPGSPDIRAAQAATWRSGVALEGPDTDALTGNLRADGGRSVHLSGKGLREHGRRWAEKVAPWLEQQLARETKNALPEQLPAAANGLALPEGENFTVEDHPAFVFLPPTDKRTTPQPWIFYAPTLPGLPDEAERWMHEQFLAAGIAVAGVDVGEAYGSPKSLAVFDALYRELADRRGFAEKPGLLGRSRGGLWMTGWALANPDRVAGIAGIYPVFDFRSYPGIEKVAPAYGFTPDELGARADEFNPIMRIGELARARIPVILIHGDADRIVPLEENSTEFVRRYREAGAESLVQLIVLEGQGHNFFEGFFRSQTVVDFVISHARTGVKPGL